MIIATVDSNMAPIIEKENKMGKTDRENGAEDGENLWSVTFRIENYIAFAIEMGSIS